MKAGVQDLMGDALRQFRQLIHPVGLGVQVGDKVCLFLFFQRGGVVAHLLRRLADEIAVLQHSRQKLGFLDGGRTDQNRLFAVIGVGDGLNDGDVFFLRRAIDLIVVVDAGDGDVGGDLHHLKPVDRAELFRLGHRGAGHAAKLVIEPEIVLEGDGGERDVFGLDLRALFRLKRLMQTVGEAPTVHHAAGEFVDQNHLGLFDDIILVPSVELVRAQRLIDVVDERDVLGVVERRRPFQMPGFAQQHLDTLGAFFGQRCGAHLFVDLVIFLDQFGNELVDGDVEVRHVFGRARDDERRARLVDQNAVDLVDDGEAVAALRHVG